MHDTPLRIIPLGGLGKIGKNMMVLEYGNDIVVVDAGVLFPNRDTPGIDLIIPNISYLIERKNKIKAILITHGHEDHIGALPYILDDLDAPVYASRLTHGMISSKLREHGKLKNARLNVVKPHAPFKTGPFQIEFFRVCHSIPDAMGIAITTPIGMVIHTGDFKIDHTPTDGNPTDFSKLARLTSEGVILLCSDSTYAEVDGYSDSDQIVAEKLDHVIGKAKSRVIVATFASLISRIQQVINAAVKHERKVTIVGRGMLNNFKMATKMGYLDVPNGTVLSPNEAGQFPSDQLVILATGAQGEPTSALARIARGLHKNIEVIPGDTIIVSSSPIPGNETVVSNVIDDLFRQGASVLSSRTAMVHVHGHGSREELKMMLNLTRPKFFLPIHGEYRHLVAHASLAQSMGIATANTFVLENGDVLELTKEFANVTGSAPAGDILIDGHQFWGAHSSILHERNILARNGIVFVTATIDVVKGVVVSDPIITSSGFVEIDESEELHKKTSEKVKIMLEEYLADTLLLTDMRSRIVNLVTTYLSNQTGRRPTVISHIEAI